MHMIRRYSFVLLVAFVFAGSCYGASRGYNHILKRDKERVSVCNSNEQKILFEIHTKFTEDKKIVFRACCLYQEVVEFDITANYRQPSRSQEKTQKTRLALLERLIELERNDFSYAQVEQISSIVAFMINDDDSRFDQKLVSQLKILVMPSKKTPLPTMSFFDSLRAIINSI